MKNMIVASIIVLFVVSLSYAEETTTTIEEVPTTLTETTTSTTFESTTTTSDSTTTTDFTTTTETTTTSTMEDASTTTTTEPTSTSTTETTTTTEPTTSTTETTTTVEDTTTTSTTTTDSTTTSTTTETTTTTEPTTTSTTETTTTSTTSETTTTSTTTTSSTSTTVCSTMWFDNYVCNGQYRQREYRNADCSITWKNYEYCSYSCLNGACFIQTTTTYSSQGSGSSYTSTTVKSVSILGMSSQVSMLLGNEKTIEIEARNNGTQILRNLKINVSGLPNGWFSLSPGSIGDLGISRVSEITLKIHPNSTGTFEAQLFATEGSGSKIYQKAFTLEVRNETSQGIKIVSGFPVINITDFIAPDFEPGKQDSFFIKLKNSGTLEAEANLEISSGSCFEMERFEIGVIIAPGEEKDLEFNITPKYDAFGNCTINAAISYNSSGQIMEDEKEFSVQIAGKESALASPVSGLAVGVAAEGAFGAVSSIAANSIVRTGAALTAFSLVAVSTIQHALTRRRLRKDLLKWKKVLQGA